jgi:hypothetical protein
MKVEKWGSLTLLVVLLSGCATKIYYPSGQKFDPDAEIDVQLKVAKTMQDEYRSNKGALANHGNDDAVANIGLGGVTASAAAFGAHIDVLKGLAIVTGVHAVGASTFKGGDQMAIYRAGESALACVVDKAVKMSATEGQFFTRSGTNVAAFNTTNQVRVQLTTNDQCTPLENFANHLAAATPLANPVDLAKAQMNFADCHMRKAKFDASMNLLNVKVAETEKVKPKAILSASLRAIDKAIFDKLSATLTAKDAATFANELKTQLDALKVKEDTGKVKTETATANNPGAGAKFVVDDALASAVKAVADAVEEKLTFEAELQRCTSAAGL